MKWTFVENLSLNYKTELWFSGSEMRLMKREAAMLLREISSHGISMAEYAEMSVHDTSAFMGLETYLTESSARNIAQRRWAVWNAVLSEQRRQHMAGICDPVKMRSVSEAASGMSSTRAWIIGKLHASKKV